MSSKIINSSLTQQSNAKGEIRNFEIYNAKFMRIKTHDLFGKKAYHINMTMLEPWPVRHRHIAWRWVIAFMYFAVTTTLCFYYQYQHAGNAVANNLFPFMIIFFLLTLVSLLFLLYQSPNVTEFRSRYGGCPLISLMQNRPEKKPFSEFVKEIKARILAASQNVSFDKKQMLSFELSELRRLTDEGILSKQLYTQAKSRVLKMHI